MPMLREEMGWARSALMAMAFGDDSTYYCGRTWCRLYVDVNWGARAGVGEEQSVNGEQGGCYWTRNWFGPDGGGCIYVKASETRRHDMYEHLKADGGMARWRQEKKNRTGESYVAMSVIWPSMTNCQSRPGTQADT